MFERDIMKYLLLSVIFAVTVFSSCTKKEEDFAVAVSFVIGDVSRNGIQLAIGEEILEGDIVTTGSSSSCDVRCGGSIIRIKEKSVMKFSKMNFTDGNENTVFGLDQGKLLCKPKKLLKDESFIVKTPTAVAAVRGTQFTVETDIKKTTRINVYDGKVKVVRRAPSLDNKIDEIMENITPLEEKESAVITKEEADKAEQAVSDGLKSSPAKDVISKNISALAIGAKDIKKFAVADFAFDKSELIKVENKPVKVVAAIKKAITLSKPSDAAGRVYLTDKDIYIIKKGRVEWEGELAAQPVKKSGKVFIASKERIVAMDDNGVLLWDKAVESDGNLTEEGNSLTLTIKGKKREINPENGKLK